MEQRTLSLLNAFCCLLLVLISMAMQLAVYSNAENTAAPVATIAGGDVPYSGVLQNDSVLVQWTSDVGRTFFLSYVSTPVGTSSSSHACGARDNWGCCRFVCVRMCVCACLCVRVCRHV